MNANSALGLRPMAPESLRILLIEDNPGDAFLFQENLERATTARVDIEHAESISRASALMSREDFDLVVVDLGLPESQGVETFHRARGLSRETPIVVFSGNEDPELRETVMELGAAEFLDKSDPGSPDDVASRLARALRTSKENEKELPEETRDLLEDLWFMPWYPEDQPDE